MRLPFPTSISVAEQKRIVAYLDALHRTVDELTRNDAEARKALARLLPEVVTLAFSQ